MQSVMQSFDGNFYAEMKRKYLTILLMRLVIFRSKLDTKVLFMLLIQKCCKFLHFGCSFR